MEHWDVAACPPSRNDGARLFLLNRSNTLISVRKGLHYDPLELFKRLEKAKFPLKYTEGLERIHFTILHEEGIGGYYLDNKIWIDVSEDQIKHLVKTFTHEVGHHVDEQEEVASMLHEERIKKAKHLHATFSKRSDDEYLAIGFENYYGGTPAERRRMRLHNPLLYRTVRFLHREYRFRG